MTLSGLTPKELLALTNELTKAFPAPEEVIVVIIGALGRKSSLPSVIGDC